MLKAVVIGLGALIVIGLVALVFGVVSKLGGHGKSTPDMMPSSRGGSTLFLESNARIVAMQSQPGRLIIRTQSPEGEEILVIDMDDGHLVSRVKAKK